MRQLAFLARTFVNATVPGAKLGSDAGVRRIMWKGMTGEGLEIETIPTTRIRNFGIIAHVDHGKSTLADRLLEATGCKVSDCRNSAEDGGRPPPTLDTLPVERERGITVKAQAATMFYQHSPHPHDGCHAGAHDLSAKDQVYMFNLIDTPGHVDFTNEVSRSLTAIQGALLVVDAVTGVQAQTMAHYWRAREHGIHAIIPIINKVDLPQADPQAAAALLKQQLGLPLSPLLVSAKTGAGVADILPAIIEHIPPPTVIEGPSHAVVVDCWFEEFRGVVCLVHVRAGRLCKGDQLRSYGGEEDIERRWLVEEVGVLQPQMVVTQQLRGGQVGWLRCGMRQTTDVFIGGTLWAAEAEMKEIKAIRSFPARHLRPMVFAGCFPATREQYENVSQAIQKLLLNDSSVSSERIVSTALGPGWRLGFLGSLHMDVFRQRLEQEFGAEVVLTAPSVSYEVAYKEDPPTLWHSINCAEDFPDEKHLGRVRAFREPYVRASIVVPYDRIGPILDLCSEARCASSDIQPLGEGNRAKLSVVLPLIEIIGEFNDRLLSLSAGYASFDYEPVEGRPVELVKVAIRLNGDPVDILSTVQPHVRAESVARRLVGRLAGLLPRQQFTVAIQAVIGNKVIARETLSALRKDVIAKCYGGDKTRKMKLLEKQKEGKARMKLLGKVEVPHGSFVSIMRLHDEKKG